MYYEGKIYRPWMEANSLLIQTTLGCTHNKCTFCDMFREKRFRIREIEEIFKDIDEARQIYRHIGSIFGIGGKERSREHIVETTRLLNIMKPEQIAPMALAIQPGTELEKQIAAGEFIQATPFQILEEEKYLLKNLAGFETIYWGDHANNIVSSRGRLPASREQFLGRIDHAIASHPVTQQEVLKTFAW